MPASNQFEPIYLVIFQYLDILSLFQVAESGFQYKTILRKFGRTFPIFNNCLIHIDHTVGTNSTESDEDACDIHANFHQHQNKIDVSSCALFCELFDKQVSPHGQLFEKHIDIVLPFCDVHVDASKHMFDSRFDMIKFLEGVHSLQLEFVSPKIMNKLRPIRFACLQRLRAHALVVNNLCADNCPHLREIYLELTQDPSSKEIVWGHDLIRGVSALWGNTDVLLPLTNLNTLAIKSHYRDFSTAKLPVVQHLSSSGIHFWQIENTNEMASRLVSLEIDTRISEENHWFRSLRALHQTNWQTMKRLDLHLGMDGSVFANEAVVIDLGWDFTRRVSAMMFDCEIEANRFPVETEQVIHVMSFSRQQDELIGQYALEYIARHGLFNQTAQVRIGNQVFAVNTQI